MIHVSFEHAGIADGYDFTPTIDSEGRPNVTFLKGSENEAITNDVVRFVTIISYNDDVEVVTVSVVKANDTNHNNIQILVRGKQSGRYSGEVLSVRLYNGFTVKLATRLMLRVLNSETFQAGWFNEMPSEIALG